MTRLYLHLRLGILVIGLMCALVPGRASAQTVVFEDGCETGNGSWDDHFLCVSDDAHTGNLSMHGWQLASRRGATLVPGTQYTLTLWWKRSSAFALNIHGPGGYQAGVNGASCGGSATNWNECSVVFVATGTTYTFIIDWDGPQHTGALVDDIRLVQTSSLPTPTLPTLPDDNTWYQYIFEDANTAVVPVGSTGFCPRPETNGSMVIVHSFGNTKTVGGCITCLTGYCLAGEFKYVPNEEPPPINVDANGFVVALKHEAVLDARPMAVFTRSWSALYANINGLLTQSIVVGAMLMLVVISVAAMGLRTMVETFTTVREDAEEARREQAYAESGGEAYDGRE